MGLEYLQRRLHNLSGQAAPVLCILIVKNFYHMCIWNFPCSHFCLLSLVLLLHTAEKSLARYVIMNEVSHYHKYSLMANGCEEANICRYIFIKIMHIFAIFCGTLFKLEHYAISD